MSRIEFEKESHSPLSNGGGGTSWGEIYGSIKSGPFKKIYYY